MGQRQLSCPARAEGWRWGLGLAVFQFRNGTTICLVTSARSLGVILAATMSLTARIQPVGRPCLLQYVSPTPPLLLLISTFTPQAKLPSFSVAVPSLPLSSPAQTQELGWTLTDLTHLQLSLYFHGFLSKSKFLGPVCPSLQPLVKTLAGYTWPAGYFLIPWLRAPNTC